MSGQCRRLGILATTPTRTTPGVDSDLAANNSNSAGVELDKATASVKGDLGAGFDHHLVASLGVQFMSAFAEPGLAGLDVQRTLYREVLISVDLGMALTPYRQVIVAMDVADAIVPNGEEAVVADLLGAVVVGQQLQVFLGVEPNLLLIRFIFKTQLVEAFRLVALGADHGARLVLGQWVGRRVDGVVGAPGNQRLIGIALKEGDNDFVADAGN